MAMKPWIPLVAAMTLVVGLAGCGNGDDEPAPAEVEETQEEPSQPVADAEEQPAAEEAESPTEAQPATADEVDVADEMDVDAESEVDLEAEGDVDAEAETLGESPADTLEEGAALPGETTHSDVDAIIEETERRFEEASRRIDEQFESAEEGSPELEPMEASPEFEPMETPAYDSDISLDEVPGSDLDEREAMPGESTSSDIEAILEETEKRFQEASRRIEEQFEEAERQAPGTSSDSDSLELDNTDGSGN
ncbi:MAG: hypothetical protein U5L98_13555 [Halomonas sp.]|uniref:LptM family lipoprotein n=1 Tax=Halomonas sp. TaxID=1486246 RepID=UPI002ACDA732|nr:hypothetical protein [Halomonas sp.]MDZ7853626.1 hypothetical protein [Halomonas sp.]